MLLTHEYTTPLWDCPFVVFLFRKFLRRRENFKTVIHHTLKFLNKVVFQILKYASYGFIFGELVKGIQISFSCSINKEQRTLRNGGLHSVLGMDRERCLWREMFFQDGHVRAEKVRK